MKRKVSHFLLMLNTVMLVVITAYVIQKWCQESRIKHMYMKKMRMMKKMRQEYPEYYQRPRPNRTRRCK